MSITKDSLVFLSISILKQKFDVPQSTFLKIDSLFDSTFSNRFELLNVKLADIDNDNDVDLILTSKDSSLSNFRILANKGKFKFASIYATALANIGDFVISDFDNNGFKDIFINSKVLDLTSKSGSIFLNLGNRFEVKSVKIPISSRAICHSLD